MTGDFLGRFVYGMRTNDRIGIPYTDIGFSPYIKFPEFKIPKKNDIFIFKYLEISMSNM